MTAATDNSRMIMLISSDGERFEVPVAAVKLSQKVLNMMIEKNNSTNNGILLPNVTGSVLAKVIEYCIKHASAVNLEADGSSTSATVDAMKTSMVDEELKNSDERFIEEINNLVLFDLIRAAKDVGIDGLEDHGCQRVADLLKGKTPEQMGQTFGIANDFMPEEEEEIRRENEFGF